VSAADLASTLPLAGLRLIEASAGTGKTYTIAGLYLRGIVELRLGVGEILVVTFTRAATEELKDRLRRRLALCAGRAEALLRGAGAAAAADAEQAFADALIARALAGGEALAELARRLRLAAVSLDEAAIQTIHGFCQRVLREHAFVSGFAIDAGELVGSDDDLIAQVAADFWRLHASDPARGAEFDLLVARLGSADALARVLRQTADPDLVVWPREAAPAADTLADLVAAIGAEDAARERLLALWRERGAADLAAVLAHAREGHLNRQSHAPDKISGWIAECAQAFAAGQLPARTTLERFGARRLADRVKKGCPPLPALPFAAGVDAWLGADAALQAAQARHWPALLARARRHAAAQLEARKQHAGRQSYDDLIRRVHAAIADPARGARLAAALHARHPLVLVDEFQDTDARQFEIFLRMHEARDDGALILVGDPKQAIYRFRGGDIETYLRAAAQAPPAYRLERNFRSSPGLLRAVEAVFAQGDPAQAFVDPRIRFHPVEAGGRAADDDVLVDGRPLAPLTCWHLDADEAQGKSESRERLAAGCAEAIVGLLRKARAGAATIREHPGAAAVALAPRHLAVLVATNDEAALMQDALAARGVASATIRQESVFASEEARDLHAFLAALENRREARLRAALASRLFGYDAAQVARLADPAHASEWQAELQRLDGLHRLWQQHGVLAMCERVFETQAAAILDGPGGERRMTNYLQLADLLQRESARLFGAAGLIDWLQRRIRLADDRNEDEQLRLESDADRVQIATVHVSKGLEYDLVFLPFTALAPGQPTTRPRVVEWHDDDRRHAWVRTNGDDDAPAGAAERCEREELAERVRVLYVALTRARRACWLSWDAIGAKGGRLPALAQLWHGGRPPGSPAEARAALARLAGSAGGVVRVEALPAPGTERLDAPAVAALPPARRFDGAIDAQWWITSFSQLRDGRRSALGDAAGADDEAGRADGAADGEPEPEAAILDGPRGDRFGTAMHAILERTDFARWRGLAGALPESERETIRACLAGHGLAAPERDGELLQVVARMVGATANVRLPGDLRLADLAPADRRAEMPFHFAIGGADPDALIALLHAHGYQRRRTDFAALRGRLAGLMTGVIDLVYRHDARWWIVDYKTNRLGARRADYAPAALAAAVREHDYDLQYVIYTLALHRWLRLRLGAGYDYARDVGGAVYLFLRGLAADGSHGVHVDRPPRALIEALDALLAPGAAR